MILYRKAQYGLGIKTKAGNMNAIMGNDSLNTASGQATHAARGFGAQNAGYSVIGDTMNNGKRSLQFKYNGGGPQLGGVNKRELMAQAQSDYLSRNPTSTNTTAPNAMDEYIASHTKAPLPAPAPKKPLMSQSTWQDNRDRTRRNNANAIAPAQSQSVGISDTSTSKVQPMGLDGKPQTRKYLGSFSF